MQFSRMRVYDKALTLLVHFMSTVRMESSVMAMLALLARDLQWKIFMRQELMVLMEKLLAFLEFSMVYFKILSSSPPYTAVEKYM